MNLIDLLKAEATKNCGACGDAFAVGGGKSIVCWANSDGSFSYAVSFRGVDVPGLSENSIAVMLENSKNQFVITGAKDMADRRGLAA